MTLNDLRLTLNHSEPPESIGPLLKALWHDAKGDWDAAHQLTQAQDGADAAWVHAYLHRKEGDESNASYWYGRAGRTFPRCSLQEEWEEIAHHLLPKLP